MTNQDLKTKLYLDIRYIDDKGNSLRTGLVRYIEKYIFFWDLYRFEVTKPKFRVYLRSADGTMLECKDLNEKGFTHITGKKVENFDYYKKIDDAYWEEERKQYEANKNKKTEG